MTARTTASRIPSAHAGYTVTTFCSGPKYRPVLPHWRARIAARCPTAAIEVFSDDDVPPRWSRTEYAWWDGVRLARNLEILRATGRPVVHCDVDVIVEKDLAPLLTLPFDFCVSTEPGGFPLECSTQLGVGACTGFYVLHPAAEAWAHALLRTMEARTFGSYSDQVALMHQLAAGSVREEPVVHTLDDRSDRHAAFALGGVRVGILDNALVTRDPVRDEG